MLSLASWYTELFWYSFRDDVIWGLLEWQAFYRVKISVFSSSHHRMNEQLEQQAAEEFRLDFGIPKQSSLGERTETENYVFEAN